MTFWLAKILLAYACFSLTEDGEECLEWSIPQGASNLDDIRVVLKDGEAVRTEERKYADGAFTDWTVSASDAGRPMHQAVNECLRLIETLGMDAVEVVGTGFNGESPDEVEDSIPKRCVKRR